VVVFLRPLYTQNQGPMTIALQALSLVERVEPIKIHFTLCSKAPTH
jgi:hypothetical protein